MTGNVKFIFNNRADAYDAISATSEAGAMLVTNLLTDELAEVWRSTSLTAQTILVSWDASVSMDSVCLAWTNLSGNATVQLKGYELPADYPATPAFDETFSPDEAAALGEFVWGIDPLAASGAQRARVASQVQCFLAQSYSIRKLEIIISDAANYLGYLEAARLVIGQSISPVVNAAQQGFNIRWVERSKPERSESGRLRIEQLGRYRVATLSLNRLEAASRNQILDMLSNGLGSGVWVSGMPEAADTSAKQLYGFWGALVRDSDLSYPLTDKWAVPLVFEEMN